jgi:hypothetical protein
MYTYVHDVEGISTYISSSVILKTGDYQVFLNLELGRQIMPDPYPPLHNWAFLAGSCRHGGNTAIVL